MNEEIETAPESSPTPETTKSSAKRFLRDVLETVGLAFILFIAINLVSARVRVEGFSMLPTLDNNQYVLVSRLSPRFSDLKRGDIIVFRPPMYPEAPWLERLLGFPTMPTDYEDYIKRVIGLPGEAVTISDDVVKINGKILEEPYIAAPPQYSGEWVVPEGYLFVLGDNRNSSSDSHSWNYLPIENVLGKAVLVYWPFSDWVVFNHEQPVLAAP